MFTVEQLSGFSSRTLYRILLKGLKYYPSINAHEILIETKSLFRQNRMVADEETRLRERKKAVIGINHVQMYNEQNDYLQKNTGTLSKSYETANPRDDKFIYF